MAKFSMPKLQLVNPLVVGAPPIGILKSKLFNEDTFYNNFSSDLRKSRKEVIIESPFITSTRMCSLIPLFRKLVARKVKCYVITRDPMDHDINMKLQAEKEIRMLQTLGIQVILTRDYSHRKLAIIDRKILWEGSLNILSQNCSQEFMRRIESEKQAQETFKFVKYGKVIY